MKTTHERFDERFPLLGTENGEPVSKHIKAFIDQEIKRAVAEREKELIIKLNNAVKHTDNVEMKTFLYTDQIINLITKEQ